MSPTSPLAGRSPIKNDASYALKENEVDDTPAKVTNDVKSEQESSLTEEEDEEISLHDDLLDDIDVSHTIHYDRDKSEEAKRDLLKLMVEVQLDSPDPPIAKERFHDSLEN